MTTREIAERVLAAANVVNPDHKGKGVERTNEGALAQWRLAAN